VAVYGHPAAAAAAAAAAARGVGETARYRLTAAVSGRRYWHDGALAVGRYRNAVINRSWWRSKRPSRPAARLAALRAAGGDNSDGDDSEDTQRAADADSDPGAGLRKPPAGAPEAAALRPPVLLEELAGNVGRWAVSRSARGRRRNAGAAAAAAADSPNGSAGSGCSWGWVGVSTQPQPDSESGPEGSREGAMESGVVPEDAEWELV
jgi:hypothetical protein